MPDFPTETRDWEKHLERVKKLEQDRKRILSLPSGQAYNEILEHSRPEALIHSFAEEDFFFLLHDIGPEDALELLGMASYRQWEFILDIEIWRRDRIELKSATRWLNLLLNAEPAKFIHWVMNEKPELIEYYLFRTLDVRIRAHDQDPSELDGDFFTFDDVFYVRPTEPPGMREADPDAADLQEEFLGHMLRRLAVTDHLHYQQTLLRSADVLPAESEEESYRFRNVRLAEKGFLPFDEAVGIYQPISVKVLETREKKLPSRRNPEYFFPVPFNHLSFLEKQNRFSRALEIIQLDEALQHIQSEFAGLCNQIAAADQKPIHERTELREIVRKACGYLEIGFERLAGKGSRLDDNRTAAFIQKYPLADLFRLGYGLVINLQQHAKKWKKQSWFENNRLALSFWDEEIVGFLGGLLLKRPKFFDNFRTEGLYREFSSLQDVKAASRALKEAMAFDDMLSCMSIDTNSLPAGFFVTYKNLLLTMWARKELDLESRPEPIRIEKFRPFYRSLWENRNGRPDIKESAKSSFLEWLSGESCFPKNEISSRLGNALESLFEEIGDEYREVKAENLDPRFVHLFMLAA